MTDAGKRAGGESSFQKTANILIPFFVYFVVHDLAQVLLAFLLNASFGFFGDSYIQFVQVNAASVNGILNALALLIGMASVLPMALQEFRWAAAREKKKLPSYGLLVIFAVSLALGMNILLALTGLTQVSDTYTKISARQYGVAFGLGILLYGVVSPLAEEMVFRGLIYNRMKRYFKLPLAIVVCGVLFGIYHGNLVQGIYGCVLGIAITFAYEWYGSFFAPVLFHGTANACVFILSYQAELYQKIVTPVYGLLFLGIAALSLGLIVRENLIKNSNNLY